MWLIQVMLKLLLGPFFLCRARQGRWNCMDLGYLCETSRLFVQFIKSSPDLNCVLSWNSRTHTHTHSSEHIFFSQENTDLIQLIKIAIGTWFNSTVVFWGRAREKSLGACCLSLRCVCIYSKNCLLQPLSFPLFLAAAENVLMWRKPEVHSQRRD